MSSGAELMRVARFGLSPRVLVWSALILCAGARPSHAQLDEASEVEIRGRPRHPNTGPKDEGVAAAVIGRERLAAPGAGAVEILRSETGLQVAESGNLGAPATAAIRGATAAQVPVYLGGVRLNDELSGVADLATVPLWLVERIEVYRGNAPIEADQLGMGGAIFIEARRPERARSGLGAMWGGFGGRAAWAYAATQPAPSDAALLVGARTEAADNDYAFADDRGTHFVAGDGASRDRENADAGILDLWVLGSARPAAGTLRWLLNHVEREQGAPKLVLLPSRAARAAFTRTLAALTSRTPVGQGSDSWIDAQTSILAATSRLDDPGFELALRTVRLETRGERVAQRLAGRLSIGRFVVRPALDVSADRLRRFDGEHARQPSLVAERTTLRMAAAAQAAPAASLSLRTLAAAECAAGCQPTGRAGFLADVAGVAVYANGNRYVRAPSLGELYGASIIVRGNPRLRPESGWGADAGTRWLVRSRRGDRGVWFDAAVFSRWAHDLVSFVRSSEGFVEPVNLDSARVRGVELDAGGHAWACCAARLSLTATDARNTTPGRALGNDRLPFVSQLVVAPALTAASAIAGGARLRGELRYVYQSSRFADAAGLAVIPAQGALDAELGGELDLRAALVVARLRVANVSNEARFDVVGFPLPGRSAFASLEVSW